MLLRVAADYAQDAIPHFAEDVRLLEKRAQIPGMDRGRVNAKIRDILFSEWLGTVESEPLEAMRKRRDKIAATLADLGSRVNLSALRIKIQAEPRARSSDAETFVSKLRGGLHPSA
jgi:hypothetical protein